MGSAYDFNLLMYFVGTSHRHNDAYLSYLCGFTPLYSQGWKSWQLYTFPGFRGRQILEVVAVVFLRLSRFLRLKQSVPASNLSPPPCLPRLCPFVSPLSPLLALCLLFCLLLLHRWKLLSFYCSEKNAKACGYQRVLSEDLGGQSPKIWFRTSFVTFVRTSFGPRWNCSQSKPSPERFWKGFANGLLLGLLLLLLLLVLADSRQGAVFWAENQEICEGAGSCAEENKSKRRCSKKKVDPISGVPMEKWMKGLIGMK